MSDGAHYSALLPGLEESVKKVNDKAKVDWSLYYSVFGEPYVFAQKFDAVPADYEFGKMFWEMSKGLLVDGKIKPIKVTVNRGGSGLEGALEGLRESKEGKVSGEKLVYTL